MGLEMGIGGSEIFSLVQSSILGGRNCRDKGRETGL